MTVGPHRDYIYYLYLLSSLMSDFRPQSQAACGVETSSQTGGWTATEGEMIKSWRFGAEWEMIEKMEGERKRAMDGERQLETKCCGYGSAAWGALSCAIHHQTLCVFFLHTTDTHRHTHTLLASCILKLMCKVTDIFEALFLGMGSRDEGCVCVHMSERLYLSASTLRWTYCLYSIISWLTS